MDVSRGRRCSLCNPRKCRRAYLYVVENEQSGLVKIGRSVNVAGRISTYRANGNRHFTLRHKRVAGCEWTSMDRETRALRILGSAAERVFGDWHRATLEQAVGAVEAACRGIKA